MRVAAPVVLTDEQRSQLLAYSRGRRTAARLVVRSRIVLLAAEGKQDLEIARLLSLVPRSAGSLARPLPALWHRWPAAGCTASWPPSCHFGRSRGRGHPQNHAREAAAGHPLEYAFHGSRQRHQ